MANKNKKSGKSNPAAKAQVMEEVMVAEQEVQAPETTETASIAEQIEAVVEEVAEKIMGKKFPAVTKTLEAPLKVFPKKDLSGKPQNMGIGSEVILQKLDLIGSTGTNVFRVKRAKSERTYYTPEENI